MDEFVIAHTVGWWAKALMLRHSGMCVDVSVALARMFQGSHRTSTATQAVGRLHPVRAVRTLVSGACARLARDGALC